MRMMVIDPKKMFSFTWNAPLDMPFVRSQLTHVILKFTEIEKDKTKLTLIHDGWGDGEEWDRAYDYFIRAWNNMVLPRLLYRFEVGPIDWNNPPKFE